MSDREKILIQYALLLGVFGENSKQTEDFANLYAQDMSLLSGLIEIVLLYRTTLLQKEGN